MGVLIPMPRAKNFETRVSKPRSGSAEIVFFTGVRYERHEEKPHQPLKSSGSNRSRRRRA